MKIEDWKGGAFAFGSVISIDDRKVEAWANLANCYTAQKRYFDAVNCSEQALKCNARNWRIWNNFILFSMETLQFYKAVRGIKTLLRNDQLESVNPALLLKVSDCFIKRYVQNERHQADPDLVGMSDQEKNEPLSDEEVVRNKRYLYKFYDDVTEKINHHKVWRLICRVK